MGVNMAEVTPCQCLGWSEVLITFGGYDYPRHVPSPGHFPLIVSPIIGWAHLMKVLMDERSGLNILYANTLDQMGIP